MSRARIPQVRAERDERVGKRRSALPGHGPVWLLLGDKAGDNAQVLALAEALGFACERKVLRPREPFVKGKPRVRASLHHLDPARSDRLEPPWPDLVITIGLRP